MNPDGFWFIPHPSSLILSVRRYAFCCTFPVLRPPSRLGRPPRTVGVTAPPRPVEPGLSSPRALDGLAGASRRFPGGDRPAGLWTSFIIPNRARRLRPLPAFWTAGAFVRIIKEETPAAAEVRGGPRKRR